jgi:hypothetical protein
MENKINFSRYQKKKFTFDVFRIDDEEFQFDIIKLYFSIKIVWVVVRNLLDFFWCAIHLIGQFPLSAFIQIF